MKLSKLILGLLPLVGALATPVSQVASNSLVGRDSTWDDAVTKGKDRMDKVKAAVAKGVDNTSGEQSLGKLFALPTPKNQHAEKYDVTIRSAVASFLGVSADSESYYNVELKSDRFGTVYVDATYSPELGVISADNTLKNSVASDHNICDADIKGMVRHQITNSETKSIVEEIYTREGKDKTADDVTISAGTTEYYALIGTPNGSGVAYMLIDHSQAMGKTTIGSILIIHGSTNSVVFKYA